MPLAHGGEEVSHNRCHTWPKNESKLGVRAQQLVKVDLKRSHVGKVANSETQNQLSCW